MAQIAGLTDSRKQGEPADIGTFQFTATALVFKFTFSGTTYTVAIQAGVSGWRRIAQLPAGTDDVVIQAALTYVAGLGGGSVYIREGTFSITATLVVTSTMLFAGQGFGTVLELAANVNAAVISIADDELNILIKEIAIDGNELNQTVASYGVYVDNTSGNLVNINLDYVWVRDVLGDGVYGVNPRMLVLHNCLITGCSGDGVSSTAEHLELYLNRINLNDGAGVAGAHADNKFIGNAITSNGGDGFSGTYANCYFIGNWIGSNTGDGVEYLGDRNTFTGNYVAANGRWGLIINGRYNTIVGNIIKDNGQDAANTYDGVRLGSDACLWNTVQNNAITGSRQRYGIWIQASVVSPNIIKNNVLQDNTTAPIRDDSGLAALATKPFQFIQGTTFISLADNPWGWEIDADTEFALALGPIPLEVQQVVRIKIWAVGLVGPGVSPGYMRAQFTGEAGASDEAYTTEPIDVVDKNCEEDNFAANDVIHWVLDATDDADIGDLLGGDSIQFKVLHEGGAGDDIETDAIFRCVEVEYV